MSSNDRTEIQLVHPIEFGERTIEVLRFRRLKAKDVRRLTCDPVKQPLRAMLEIAGYLTGEPQPVIDLLEGEDVMKVIETASLFFAASPLTGTAPLPSSE